MIFTSSNTLINIVLLTVLSLLKFFPKQRLCYGVLTRVLYPVECSSPPGWLYACSFLLLFTTLLHRTMHFVEMRAALGPLFLVKHNTFEHSNGPLALRAPWAPGVHK